MDGPAVSPAGDGRVLPWRQLLAALVAVSAALTLTSYVTLELVDHRFFQVGGGGHAYLNVGVEGNIPTWWSASVLVAGATVTVMLAWLLRSQRLAGVWPTAAIAALLLAFSLDELVALHEHLHRVGRLLVSAETLPFVWLAVGIPLALGVGVVAVLLARRVPAAVRPLLLGGLAVFFTGAVGLELVGSQLHGDGGVQSPAAVAVYHLEELLEMTGAALMAVAPLRAVRVTGPGTTLRVAVS
ncbi:hypothetical protein [Georgenia sp. H159]|uniref:hypothetical protein n=1 Tax=Georgenia sp. H159 TaxID=3076115 RepID=UPI002D790754|nr:hypothetical protein [Georgenia sp. H159]